MIQLAAVQPVRYLGGNNPPHPCRCGQSPAKECSMCEQRIVTNLGCEFCNGDGGWNEYDSVPYGDTYVSMPTWEPCELCAVDVDEEGLKRLCAWVVAHGGNVQEILEAK